MAVNNGETCLGIKAKDGVVIGCEKTLSSVLVDSSSIHKIEKLSEYIGTTYAGLSPDFRVLLGHSRKIAMQYYHIYCEEMPVPLLCKEIALSMQESTQAGGMRPYGCSMLV